MTKLEKYFAALPLETVFMYFFSHGCEKCPAKEFCDQQSDDTCCHQNFVTWAETDNGEETKLVAALRRMADNSRSKHELLAEAANALEYAEMEKQAGIDARDYLRTEQKRLQADLDAAKSCIAGIEEALKFQRWSSAALRIAEWRRAGNIS